MEGVRRATPDDADRLAELAAALTAELAAQARGGRIFTTREASRPPLDNLVVYAGTLDDVVVGFGTGRTETLADGAVLGVIDHLYVEPEARGVGVGEALMGELLAWFRGQGCIGVDAMALPGMRATKNFFEANGFTARLLTVHHRFDADA